MTLVIFLPLFGVFIALTSEDCCFMKRVGGKTYQLEEQNVEDAVNKFDCNEACTYSRKDETNPEKRYCFKSGKLESECLAPKEYALDEKGRFILHIEIKNELSDDVSGDIIYEDNVRQTYSVTGLGFEDIVPQDELDIKKITGTTDSGVICKPFVHEDDEEPRRKFHIVSDEEGGCVILPASEQYHHIAPTHWYENGELVKQQDYFHPGTREAILKTEAHGDNHATTMIFQSREATRSRRSTGVGLMVTAAGAECHVNELNDEIDVNPEHILVPRAPSVPKNSRSGAGTESKTIHKYITNSITSTRIISPDDENVKLTETMKKSCEGKTIYYNSQHAVESGGEELKKGGVVGDQDNMKQRQYTEKFSPQMPDNNPKRAQRNVCFNKKIKWTETYVANCGLWKYNGVYNTTEGFAPNPISRTSHYHTRWSVAAECCDDGPDANGKYSTNYFPCEKIPDGATAEAEQAFSTAYALSVGKGFTGGGTYPFCMGISRFCEWNDTSTKYADLGITVAGACTSHCTSFCNSYQISGWSGNNGGCYKCFGMYPGYHNRTDPCQVNPVYQQGGFFHGNCSVGTPSQALINLCNL